MSTKINRNTVVVVVIISSLILTIILVFHSVSFGNKNKAIGKTSPNDNSGKVEEMKYYWKFWRTIVSDFTEGVLFVDEVTANRYIYTYRIDIIALHNKIVRFEFSKVDPTAIRDLGSNYSQRKLFSFCNRKLFWLLKQQFKHEYYAPLNESELFADCIVYGDNCGIAPIDPPERIKIDGFVNTHSRDSLQDWLQSTNTEMQMYAVDGLWQLKRKGITLNYFELNLIRKILSKKGTIYTCFGCIYNSEKIVRIKETFKNLDW